MLDRNFLNSNVNAYIYKLLTCVSLPQLVNPYHFLVNTTKLDLQKAYEAGTVMERLQLTADIFNDFVSKVEIWSQLEQ